jgi:hypothetical protein
LLYARASTKQASASLIEVFGKWAEAMGPSRFSWWRRYDRSQWQSFDAKLLPSITAYLARPDKSGTGARLVALDPPESREDFILAHARLAELEFVLLPRGSYYFSNSISRVYAMMPVHEFVENAERWRDLVLAACEEIPVSSGLAGFALSEGDLHARDKAVDRAMTEVYSCYNAVEVGEDLSELLVRRDRIRGVGWLTLLGAEAQKILGGEARIRSALGSDATVHRTAHALVIQAGPRPVLGDDPATLAPYRAVYAVVKSLLAPVLASLTSEGKALFQRLA